MEFFRSGKEDMRTRDQYDPLRHCRRVYAIALLATAYSYARTFDF